MRRTSGSDLTNVYELLKEREQMPEEILPKKPWWKSRKILLALVGGVLQIIAVFVAHQFGFEIPPPVLLAVTAAIVAAILGIAHEDAKIISAKIMAAAGKEIEKAKSGN